MLEYYLNKDAKITIAFTSWVSGGSGPREIVGRATEVDDEFLSIEFDPNHKENKISFKNTSGKMIVNKKYIISIILL